MSSIRTILTLFILALLHGVAFAQPPDHYTGTWESADQHFRLIVYRHQGIRQILFYGQDEAGIGHNRYVTRAINIREGAQELLFELPPHPVYGNNQGNAAIAGHQSELPAADHIDNITLWRLAISDDILRLDCALSVRRLCGLQHPVELHSK